MWIHLRSRLITSAGDLNKVLFWVLLPVNVTKCWWMRTAASLDFLFICWKSCGPPLARSPSLSAAGKREERDLEIEAERETEKGKLKQKQGPNWTQLPFGKCWKRNKVGKGVIKNTSLSLGFVTPWLGKTAAFIAQQLSKNIYSCRPKHTCEELYKT